MRMQRESQQTGSVTPVLVVNPRTDAKFAQRVDDLMRERELTAEELALRLRETYPRAVVRRRLLSGESRETWYVYREGTWIPSDAEMLRQTSRQQLTTWSPMPDASKLWRS